MVNDPNNAAPDPSAKPRLILVLGDQLSHDLSALRHGDRRRDLVVMAEVADETTYVPHHPRKIALILSAMRHFAQELKAKGWQVAYTRLDDPEAAGSIPGELLRRAAEIGADQVIATLPGEHRVTGMLQVLPLTLRLFDDDRFLASPKEFAQWTEGRKELRMEYFYRQMRRKTGYLMRDDQPEGGKWNYDSDNRKPAQRNLMQAAPLRFDPDEITDEVLELVAARFGGNFGRLDGFDIAVTRRDARRALAHFVAHQLAEFGDFQDAMLCDEPFLNHAFLSAYMNIGLLCPREVCDAVVQAYRAGSIPINSAEGFIRQVIGWREYVRGIYHLKGPDYVGENQLGHDRPLPDAYWGGATQMTCLREAVGQTRDLAYAHHIQRLMVTGNFALLMGVDPKHVHEWYLAVYVDAFEWVEAPNTIGMSQWADGGVVASKPYVSSANYINKMSDYCGGCTFDPKIKQGKGACPFNLLYWHFLDRHRERFAKNPRMGVVYKSWDRMEGVKKAAILSGAQEIIEAGGA
jgi:deoxyribodipyrimidine photolyase-related protein